MKKVYCLWMMLKLIVRILIKLNFECLDDQKRFLLMELTSIVPNVLSSCLQCSESKIYIIFFSYCHFCSISSLLLKKTCSQFSNKSAKNKSLFQTKWSCLKLDFKNYHLCFSTKYLARCEFRLYQSIGNKNQNSHYRICSYDHVLIYLEI